MQMTLPICDASVECEVTIVAGIDTGNGRCRDDEQLRPPLRARWEA